MQPGKRGYSRQPGNCLLIALMFMLTGGIMNSAADDEEEVPKSPLRSELRAFTIEKTEDGEEEFTQAERVEPGDVIEYRLRYRNVSEQALTEIVATGPIHESTDYVEGSATASVAMTPQFSIDQGGSFQFAPVTYQVALADGRIEEREATPDMYTHVRWRIAELPPSEETELRYRVRVR